MGGRINDMSEKIVSICPRCQVGHLQVSHVTFTHLLNGHVLSIPNAPALICDMCEQREYDPLWLAEIKQVTGVLDDFDGDTRLNVRPNFTDLSELPRAQRVKP
jgi:YgiT-type zinc finger domain-containing protein